jgi:hypothetical protein
VCDRARDGREGLWLLVLFSASALRGLHIQAGLLKSLLAGCLVLCPSVCFRLDRHLGILSSVVLIAVCVTLCKELR